jgi:hypothetical protein
MPILLADQRNDYAAAFSKLAPDFNLPLQRPAV